MNATKAGIPELPVKNKGGRPPNPRPADPSAGAQPSPTAAQADREVWVDLEPDEVTDAFLELFETFAECIGPEWALDESKAKRIGARWSRLGNRWAKRVQSKIALKALVYAALGFAVLQLGGMVVGRAMKTITRKRKEREEKKSKAKAIGQVVPIGDAQPSAEAASG